MGTHAYTLMLEMTPRLLCVFFVFVFFSSRRRHTRLQGDWSSDVCSSDLLLLPFCFSQAARLFCCWPCNRSEEHTSELQSPCNLVCRLLLEKKKKQQYLIIFLSHFLGVFSHTTHATLL